MHAAAAQLICIAESSEDAAESSSPSRRPNPLEQLVSKALQLVVRCIFFMVKVRCSTSCMPQEQLQSLVQYLRRTLCCSSAYTLVQPWVTVQLARKIWSAKPHAFLCLELC